MRYLVGGVSLSEEKVFALLLRYKKALEGLTPGGSEYVNDPERCAAHVRERFDSYHRVILMRKSGGTDLA